MEAPTRIVLGIDPGPEQSAFCRFDGHSVVHCGIEKNQVVKDSLPLIVGFGGKEVEVVAIEMVACYGMPVGAEVFETCVWIGRMIERSTIAVRRVYRKDVKMHFCQNMRAKDSNIRQAIIDRFGGKEKAIGLKASPGPLYSVKSHIWAALAVAIFTHDQNQ